MKLLVDTGPLLAAVLPKDPDHEAAVGIFRRIGEGEWRAVHTTDLVVVEALNFIRMKVKRAATAEALLGLVFGEGEMPPAIDSVVRVHSGRFAEALDRYRTRFDSGLSFTDHASIVVAEEMGIGQIATFDDGFRRTLRVVDGR